jgi:hypothetical protein
MDPGSDASADTGLRTDQVANSGFLLGVEQALVELHAKGKAEGFELLLDLVERLLAEVPVLEHLLLGLHRQFAHRGDVGVVQAVGCANRQLDLVDRHVQQLAQLVLLLAHLGLLVLELVGLIADAIEDIEVVLENRRGLLERVVGRDAPVRPDFEDQFVVVGDLSDAGVLDRVLDELTGEKSESIGMTPIACSSFLFCSPG